MPPTTTLHLVHQCFMTKILWTPTMRWLRIYRMFSRMSRCYEKWWHTSDAASNRVNDWLLFLFITDNDNILHNVWRKLQSMMRLSMRFSSSCCLLPFRLQHPLRTLFSNSIKKIWVSHGTEYSYKAFQDLKWCRYKHTIIVYSCTVADQIPTHKNTSWHYISAYIHLLF